MLGKFIAGDFIAIAGEMRRFPASNENTASLIIFTRNGLLIESLLADAMQCNILSKQNNNGIYFSVIFKCNNYRVMEHT